MLMIIIIFSFSLERRFKEAWGKEKKLPSGLGYMTFFLCMNFILFARSAWTA